MQKVTNIALALALALASGSGLAAGPADLSKAKQNYDRFCAACHGFNGMSVAPDAPNLRMNQGLLQPDALIVQKLKMGSAKKPPMLGMMSDQDLQQVVSYARSLR